MNITCPHCQAVLNPKGIKPGKYQPKCPKCQKPFQIVVPDDPSGSISVRQITRTKSPPTPKAAAPVEQAPPAPAPDPKPLDLDEIAARLLAAKTDLDIPVDHRNAPDAETGVTGDLTAPDPAQALRPR